MNPDELTILIHNQPALTTKIEGESPTGRVEPGDRWHTISVAWSDPPNASQLDLWIDACLPENGSREEYVTRAEANLHEHGIELTCDPTLASTTLAWASPDAEYPGAVSFKSACTTAQAPTYQPLGDDEIGARLHEASKIANENHERSKSEHTGRSTSLSGARGKIGLARLDGRWHAAHGPALSDWIAKHEDNRKLQGEAGVESICQRATALLGLPAAQTLSRVFGGQQCVLSRRADRHHDPVAGITAIHQEDFAQATSWPGTEKYEQGSKNEPRWKEAYALLRAHGVDPDAEQAKLTRMLAITWILGHCDLHRRNLGFTHQPTDGAPRIRLAPAYDVSSAIETIYDKTLAIGIAKARILQRIGPRQWITHAQQCGLDPDYTLEIVRETVRDAPEAIAAAREAARTEDENRLQATVDHRMEKLVEYTRSRQREFASQETRRAKKNAATRTAQHTMKKTEGAEETREAAQYLKGDGLRPALDTLINKIAEKHLRDPEGAKPSTYTRDLAIYSQLRPHTRLRPKEESEHQLDRENLGPVRSSAAAYAASEMLTQALDRYQAERYGKTEDGTPKNPPPADSFRALTAKGREKKRQEYIEEAIDHWRTRIAHKVVRDIRKTVIPIEVKFRRELAKKREEDARASEERLEKIAEKRRSRPPRQRSPESPARD